MRSNIRTGLFFISFGFLMYLVAQFSPAVQADSNSARLENGTNLSLERRSIDKIVSFEEGVYIFSTLGELWVLEHTRDQPVFLQKVCSPPQSPIMWQETFYFLCDLSLWQSDGTPHGTYKVLDLPHPEQETYPQKPLLPIGFSTHLIATTDTLFILLQDQSGMFLWKMDGATDGITLVKQAKRNQSLLDTFEIFFGYSAVQHAVINNIIYFTAYDEAHGFELWKSDGTEAGTTVVKDIILGNASSYPNDLKVLNAQLYFGATDSEHGSELWRSDGTSEGTQLVKDINPGEEDSYLRPIWGGVPCLLNLHVVAGKLFFTAGDSLHGRALWQSDGTEDGTELVADMDPERNNWCDDSFSGFTQMNDKLIFSYAGGIFTATDSGVESVPALSQERFAAIGTLTPVGDQVFFIGDDNEHGKELWISDLTEEGTKLLKDITPGEDESQFSLLTASDSFLYFTTGSLHSILWRSDGISEGTVRIFTVSNGTHYYMPIIMNMP
ncbi:MAG: hypothetical protein R3A44_29820 [Caldilineaceae bacterium]